MMDTVWYLNRWVVVGAEIGGEAKSSGVGDFECLRWRTGWRKETVGITIRSLAESHRDAENLYLQMKYRRTSEIT